jgi:hypothetical protein
MTQALYAHMNNKKKIKFLKMQVLYSSIYSLMRLNVKLTNSIISSLFHHYILFIIFYLPGTLLDT